MYALIISCEHGGNKIPPRYQHLFRGCESLLESHRGYDPGALITAQCMSKSFSAPLISSSVSRLLVDLNRSVGHRHLHMESIARQPVEVRQQIINDYWQAYRSQVNRLVEQGMTSKGRVIHISCHSFTNCLDGIVRNADIGLLYDPARTAERLLCRHWKAAIEAYDSGWRVRRNYPYQGRNDGLTTSLRRQFPMGNYIGIELELNQKNLAGEPCQWAGLRELLINTLDTVIKDNFS